MTRNKNIIKLSKGESKYTHILAYVHEYKYRQTELKTMANTSVSIQSPAIEWAVRKQGGGPQVTCKA